MYKLTKNNFVIRLSDNAHIPNAPGNRDWDEYQKWIAKGNSPVPAESLAETKTRRIGEIRADAGARILARHPDYKQRNLLARLHELHDKRLDGLALTAPEQAEVTNFRAAWDWVRQTRQASNDAEAKVSSAVTIAEVDAVVPLWPL